MRNRTFLLSLGLTVLGRSAMAAIPDSAAPAEKPPLYHASPMINDPVAPTIIHGKVPDGSHIIGAPNAEPKDPTGEYLQAQIPDKAKPPLYRASPMINDPVTGTTIRGKAPVLDDQLIRGSAPTSNSTH